MKIVRLDDCEWWIGESIEACVEAAAKEYGNECSQYEDAYALDDVQLDKHRRAECDENEERTGVEPTFREAMVSDIADGGDFPRMFACTEY